MKNLLVSFILMTAANVVMAQVEIHVSVSGASKNFSPPTGCYTNHVLAASISNLPASGYSTLNCSVSNLQYNCQGVVYRGPLTNGWRGTLTAKGEVNYITTLGGNGCGTESATVNQQITYSASAGCQKTVFTASNSVYRVEVIVTITTKLQNVVAGAITCGDNQVALSTAGPGATFDWYVSENGITETRFRASASSSIVATQSELFKGQAKYGTRYIRARDASCTERKTDVVAVKFFPPPAKITVVTPVHPTCHNETGKISVTIQKQSDSVKNYLLTCFALGGAETYLIAQAEVFVSGSTATYTFENLSTNQTKQRNFRIVATNHTNIGRYSACKSAPVDVTLVNPDLVVATITGVSPLCPGKSDGTLTAVGSGGSGIFTTYQWSGLSSATTKVVSNARAGQYSVVVKDDRNCASALATINLNDPTPIVPQVIVLDKGGGHEITCFGGSDGEMTVTATGGAGGYTFSLDNGVFTAANVFTSLRAKAYQINVKDANSCIVSRTETLSEPENIDFEIYESVPIHCPGKSSGTLAVKNIRNTVGTLSYLWSTGEVTSSVSNKTAATYSLEIKDGKGCTASESYTLGNPVPYTSVISATSDYNGAKIRCHGGSDGVLTVVTRDGSGSVITPSSFQWYKDGSTVGSSTAILMNCAIGEYKVKATYNGDCVIESEDFILSEPTQIISAVSVVSNYNGKQISCKGRKDGQLTVTATGGTTDIVNGLPQYTYSWNTNPASTNKTITTGAGTYSVTVKDKNGCASSASGTLIEPAQLVSSITETGSILCHGGTGKLEASATGGTYVIVDDKPNYSYAWSKGGSGTNTVIGQADTYKVTISDINGCTTESTYKLSQPEELKVQLQPNAQHYGRVISCPGASDGEVIAMPSGGVVSSNKPYRYFWNNSTQAGNSSLIGKAGTFSVTVEDANTCKASASVIISDPPAIISSVDVTKPITCHGYADGVLTITAKSGTPPYSYKWKDTDVTAISLTASAGTYRAIITDANSCEVVADGTLVNPAPIGASIEITTSYNGLANRCNGGSEIGLSAKRTGGVGAITYDWNTGAKTQSLSGQKAGSYSVRITDSKQCFENASIVVADPSPLQVTISPQVSYNGVDVSCFGKSDAVVRASATGGAKNYKYEWDNNVALRDSIRSGLPAGSYTVKVTDRNNCSSTKTYQIMNPSPVSVDVKIRSSFNGQELSCYNAADGKIEAVASGGTGSYTYKWNQGHNTSILDKVGAGTYEVIVSDINSCTTRKSVTIQNPLPVHASVSVVSNYNGVAISCHGAQDGAVEAYGSGGTGSYAFRWASGDTTQRINNLAAGNYIVQVTDKNGCSDHAEVQIHAPHQITPTISVLSNYNGLPLSCFGATDGSLVVNKIGGTGSLSYLWNTGDSTSQITNIGSGNFTVTVKDQNKCTESASISIEDPEPVIASIIGVSDYHGFPVSCHNSSDAILQAYGSGGTRTYNYLWNTGDTTSNLDEVGAGSYYVVVSDQNNCKDTAEMILNAPEPLSATIQTVSDYNGSPIRCYGSNDGMLQVIATGGTHVFKYKWNNGDTTRWSDELSAGTYSVYIEDENHCVTEAESTIAEPDPLNVSIQELSNYNGFGVKCFASADGWIKIESTGGTGSHNYVLNDSIDVSSTISNLTSGHYKITASDVNGCISEAQADLTSPEKFKVTLINVEDVTCYGGSNGLVEIIADGGVFPYESKISDGNSWQTQMTFDSLRSNIYTIEARDHNGCTDTVIFEIRSPDEISATFENTPALCNESIGSTTVSVSGGTGLYRYHWSDQWSQYLGDGNSLTGQAPGILKVQITDEHQCNLIAYTSITGIDGPVVSMQNIKNPSCFHGGDGTASIQIFNGTPPFKILWSSGDTTESVSNLNAGRYAVSVVDSFGCQTAASIFLQDPPVLSLTLKEAIVPVSCNGNCNGKINVLATGGTGVYSYDWGSQKSSIAQELCAGSHTVVVTDSHGCSTSSTFHVPEPLPLSIQIRQKNNPSCHSFADGQIVVAASGGNSSYQFDWSNGSQKSTTSGLRAGEYSVTVVDSKSCKADTSIVLTEPLPLEIELIQTELPRCSGTRDGSILVKAHGGSGIYNYSWDSGSRFALASSLSSGIHSLSVRDSKNCIAQRYFLLNEPEALTLKENLLSEPACNNSCDGKIEVTPSGGNGSYRYSWSNGSRSSIAASLCSGEYVVNILDAKNCSAQKNFQINQPDPIVVELVDKSSSACSGACNGQLEIRSSGGSGEHHYLWTSGSSGTVARNLCPGEHQIYVRDDNNCKVVASFNIEKFAPVELELETYAPPSCFQQCDGYMEVKSRGGNGFYSYQWSTGDKDPKAELLCAGDYFVTVSDETGCRASRMFSLQQPDKVQLHKKTLIAPTCFGSCDGKLEVSASGGVGSYTYNWSSGQHSATVSSLCSNDYWITATDKNGCSTTELFTLFDPPAIEVDVSNMTIPSCYGYSDAELEVVVEQGKEPYSYKWENGEKSKKRTNLSAGIYNLQVTDANGCNTQSSFLIGEPDAIQVSASRVIPPSCHGICDGSIELFVVGASGVYDFLWNSGATMSKNSSACGGENSVLVTDQNGCQSSTTFFIEEPLPISIDIEEITLPSCYGDCNGSVKFSVTGGTAPFTIDSQFGQHENTLRGICAGDYAITIKDANECLIQDDFKMPDRPELKIDLGGSKILCDGQAHVLDAGGPWHSCDWYGDNGFRSFDSRISLVLPGTYWVNVMNERGCEASDTFLLESPVGLLSPDFIMASQVEVGDTIVIVDVSWPVSSQSFYSLPDELGILSQTEDILTGVFDSLGTYSISLTARVGDCSETITKVVSVVGSSIYTVDARLGYEAFVKSIDLFSNPNNGSFDFNIEFSEETSIILTVWSLPSGHLHGKLHDQGSISYRKHIDLRPLPAGHYVLRIDHERGKEYVRFIVH